MHFTLTACTLFSTVYLLCNCNIQTIITLSMQHHQNSLVAEAVVVVTSQCPRGLLSRGCWKFLLLSFPQKKPSDSFFPKSRVLPSFFYKGSGPISENKCFLSAISLTTVRCNNLRPIWRRFNSHPFAAKIAASLNTEWKNAHYTCRKEIILLALLTLS